MKKSVVFSAVFPFISCGTCKIRFDLLIEAV